MDEGKRRADRKGVDEGKSMADRREVDEGKRRADRKGVDEGKSMADGRGVDEGKRRADRRGGLEGKMSADRRRVDEGKRRADRREDEGKRKADRRAEDEETTAVRGRGLRKKEVSCGVDGRKGGKIDEEGRGKSREGVQVDAEEQDRKKRIDEKLGYKRKSNCISQSKDSINKTCSKNGKDLSNGAPKIKL